MLIGIIGKPNVGKSTFFKAATLAEVLIANYPFATIKPNTGVAYVKTKCIDTEFNTQCMPRTGFCLNHIRFVPVQLMDVAGLVEGASEGKGLGNQFLDDLRQADLFIQIVDASGTTSMEGKPISGGHNPCEDVIFLEKELDLWYLGILNKVWKTFSRTLNVVKGGNEDNFAKAIAKQFSGLKISEFHVEKALKQTGLISGNAISWSEADLFKFARELRKIGKPMIIAANKCDHPDAKANLDKLKQAYPNEVIIPCSADSELALRQAAKAGMIEYIPGEKEFKLIKELSPKQKEALEAIKKNVLDVFGNTGIQNALDIAVFDFLKYIAIFPASPNKLADSKGNILPDCFLLKEGSTALDFAYSLHTDIGKNFIKAIDARNGKMLGKDYKLKHRDALEIVTR
jgi:ribosome-binding ATPase YchF (GTP1/OBG family)